MPPKPWIFSPEILDLLALLFCRPCVHGDSAALPLSLPWSAELGCRDIVKCLLAAHQPKSVEMQFGHLYKSMKLWHGSCSPS